LPNSFLPAIRRREVPAHGLPTDLHPVLARVLAARGVVDGQTLKLELGLLQSPQPMKGLERAASLLAEAIAHQRRIVIAGDYDADGATGVALAVRGLRRLGARNVDYVVPHRLTMGYGLSPALAEIAAAKRAEVLVTVDNGIASLAGVARAQQLEMQVIVTDHHLPGLELPPAHALVNPNQPGCAFPSKHLAGVGVMFYLLSQLRRKLRDAGHFTEGDGPPLAPLLDLVALGTVADLVYLDHNNRILVAQGLVRIRAGRACAGIQALLQVAGRAPEHLSAIDLGFVLGPRINAAGRLDDIRIGIECLLAESVEEALPLARALDGINRSRRELQEQMSEEALAQLADGADAASHGLSLFDENWHEGIVGLVAARVKEACHRPVVAFARAQESGMLKGSARTIEGLHLRDALAAIDAQHPGLIERFGGHAMAAGLSLRENQLDLFRAAFDDICQRQLRPEQLARVRHSDGALAGNELNVETALAIEQGGPWGQGMPEPTFDNRFEVLGARTIGSEGQHVRYRLRHDSGVEIGAVDFGGGERIRQSGSIHALYALSLNRWKGNEIVELRIEHLDPL
jgi:single-stranded-DNA-specific exonuclease